MSPLSEYFLKAKLFEHHESMTGTVRCISRVTEACKARFSVFKRPQRAERVTEANVHDISYQRSFKA